MATVILNEWEAKERLGAAMPRVHEVRSASVDVAVVFARSVHGPVVAKASGVAHKTEVGGVRLDLNADGVAACWAELAAMGDGTVLVAEQVRADVELIVGGLRDPSFGPVVSVGIGGVAAEVLADVVFLLAPVEDGELDAALAMLRGAALLDGHRGAEPVDRTELRAIVDAVAGLLVDDPTVTEIDCNPVMVVAGHPKVVDALVVTSD
jgi:acetate---CoA ligase (ADP-forming) subunit beta